MEINKDNYKDWLIRYLENDLSMTERADVELFVKENSEAATEWELLKRTRLQPDLSIRFPNKSLLFRTEEPVVELKKTVIIYSLYRYAAFAAAAAVLAFVIIFTLRKPENKTETAQSDIKKEISPLVKTPVEVQKVYPNQPQHVLANEIKNTKSEKGRLAAPKRNLVANNLTPKQKGQNASQSSTPKPRWQDPGQNVDKQFASGTTIEKPVEEIVKPAPKNPEIAVTKQPVSKSTSHVPAKTAAYHANDDDNETMLGSLLSLFHHVSLKKEEKNQQTYYALSIQTSNISINKSFK